MVGGRIQTVGKVSYERTLPEIITKVNLKKTNLTMCIEDCEEVLDLLPAPRKEHRQGDHYHPYP